MTQAMIALLLAVRAAAVALIAAIDAFEVADEPEVDADGKCLHPEAQRLSTGTMAHANRFLCRRCGEEGGTK